MGQLLVRGLDDRLIAALKQRARAAGMSVEALHRSILEQAVPVERESFIEACKRLQRTTPPSTLDSTDIIRAFRDRNWQMED